MKTIGTSCIALCIALALPTASSGQPDESPLELHGKTIQVYPVLLGEPGKVDVNKGSRDMAVRVAEVVGVMLEQVGMVPSISPDYPETITTEGDLAQMEKGVRAIVDGRELETDYALFARMLGTRTSKGPVFTSICAVLTDSNGQIAWSKDCAESCDEPPDCPMGACLLIAQTLLEVSDLQEPEPGDAPQGAMAQRMDERSGLPPKAEIDAMDKRLETALHSFSQATLTVYPFRVWGDEEGSTESAKALAEKLSTAGLFQTVVAASVDTGLKAQRDRNQMKILWDSAHMFQDWLREHPADTDYALLVDLTIPAHHLHLILCEGAGEWVMLDFQNSHHNDFNQIDPKTLEEGVTLAFRRLEKRLN